MSLLSKIRALLFIWKWNRFDSLPFNRKMKYWLTWHRPYRPSYTIDKGSYCPNCKELM